MDVKKFISECKRMCNYYGGRGHCKRMIGETTELCPLWNLANCAYLPDWDAESIDEVEKWSKTHPVNTRQSEFLKLFPNAKMWSDDNFLSICPKKLDATRECLNLCYDCCRKYWSEVVE
jgi:hypothetical protein